MRRLKTKAAMKEPRSKRKLNDRGMSLVEVIISITILSVVVVPVMHALTSAAYYNLKARNRQNVTFAAESLMEAFKGYDIFDSENPLTPVEGSAAPHKENLDTLEWLFSDDKVDANNQTGKEKLTAMLGAREIGSVGCSIGSDKSAEFTISDMEAEDGRVYDVKIKATPGGEQEILELDNFSEETDAVFIGPPAGVDEALAYIKNDFLENYCRQDADGKNVPDKSSFIEKLQEKDARGEKLTTNDIADAIDDYLKVESRDIRYIINSATDVKCEISYTYGIEKIKYFKPIEEESSSETESSTEDEGIERETETDVVEDKKFEKIEASLVEDLGITGFGLEGVADEDKLKTEPYFEGTGDFVESTGTGMFKRLFIYYYPAYKRVGMDGDKNWSDYKGDSIIIEDGGSAVADYVDCYLIKQNMLADVIGPENGIYKSELMTCDEKYQPKVKAVPTGKFRLYHNLNENIAGGIMNPNAQIDVGTFIADGVKEYDDAKLTKKKKVLVYSLTIEVWDKAKPDKPVTTLTGSMNERLVNNGAAAGGNGAGSGGDTGGAGTSGDADTP